MIVVADTGPVLNLAYGEMLWLLPALGDVLMLAGGDGSPVPGG